MSTSTPSARCGRPAGTSWVPSVGRAIAIGSLRRTRRPECCRCNDLVVVHVLGSTGGGSGALGRGGADGYVTFVAGTEGAATLASSAAETSDSTRAFVESALFASATGLLYLVSGLLRVESYLAMFFPLPTIVVAGRWGVRPALRSLGATLMLIGVLAGPVRALAFLAVHGAVGGALAWAFRRQLPWSASITAASLVRAIGIFFGVQVSSWLMGENLTALVIGQVHAMAEHMCSTLGFAQQPSVGVIALFLVVVVGVNSCCYVFLVHCLYTLILYRLGLKAVVTTPPKFLRSILPVTGGDPDAVELA